MDRFRIQGGVPLLGEVAASGSKNAALPILAATILASEPVWLENVPRLADVDTLSLLLGHLGVEVKRQRDGRLKIATVDASPALADYELVRQMRASFCVLGPLVARRGKAIVSLPGGCNIGDRPVDLHLKGLAALGADVRIEHGYVIATARKLRGARIHLAGPRGPTVTGTANVLSAATLATGKTVITGAAIEPEIVDLARFLTALGARIVGAGTSTLEITGVEQLGGGEHRVIPDRIEAATLMLAVAITGGAATVTGIIPHHLTEVIASLQATGVRLDVESDRILVAASGPPRPINITASPYPGVPTDLQAQFTALLALADGSSLVRDLVFGDRFRHVAELNRLGAHVARQADAALVTGVRHLTGAAVLASDLRASAALVLAGLAARGETTIERIDHLDRGYERLDAKLTSLGARIERLPTPEPSPDVSTSAQRWQRRWHTEHTLMAVAPLDQ